LLVDPGLQLRLSKACVLGRSRHPASLAFACFILRDGLWNSPFDGYKCLFIKDGVMLVSLLRGVWAYCRRRVFGARHALGAEAPLAYHHPLEDAVFEGLLGAPAGVFVHWGAYGSGKSTAVRAACQRLQAAGRTVILLHGFDHSSARTARALLRRAVGVPDDVAPISGSFVGPTTVVVDHFDAPMQCLADTLAHLRELAAESAAAPSVSPWNLLLVVTSWERAVELRDGGCRLLGSPSRWTEAELGVLFATLPEAVRRRWLPPEREELLRLAALSGTPGFLIMRIQAERYGRSAGRASVLDLEWRKGARALVEGAQDMGPGRFPDRDGVFHWEDIPQGGR
jgi:hypothetical protein